MFKSWFTLEFSAKEIEEDYQLYRESLIKTYIRILTLIIFIVSVGNSVQISFFFVYSDNINFFKILYMSYILTAVYIVLVGLVYKYIDHPKMIKSINLLNYYFLVFIFINLRFPSVRFIIIDPMYFYMFLLVEIILRLIWASLGINTFLEYMIINLISVATIYGVYVPCPYPKEREKSVEYMGAISIGLVVANVSSYILERQVKKTYYLNYQDKLKTKWFSNILDNMNTGFLSIKENSISYINAYLNNKFIKGKYLREDISDNQKMNLECKLFIDEPVTTSYYLELDPNTLLQDLILTIQCIVTA
jgi:hypothetical protein